MDAHAFRIIAAQLLRLLNGARVEKIHGPHPDVFVFTIFDNTQKRRLVLRSERQNPLLFLTNHSIANPPQPPALVMRIRKYCAGKRLDAGIADMDQRALALPLHFSDETRAALPDKHPKVLLLDMVRGPSVVPHIPEGFGTPPTWPDAELVASLCSRQWKKGEKDGPWQNYSVLTPLLRETLALLDPLEGQALMVDLEAGGGSLFVYQNAAGIPALYSAWPLPEEMCARRGLTPCSEENVDASEPFPDLAASALVDEPQFFKALSLREQKEETAPIKKAEKKHNRLLLKLEQEEKRLRAMLDLREDAKALQAVLWQYPPDAKHEEITAGEGKEARRIRLNSLLTLRENMLRMFKESARGKRGLNMLEKRKADIASAGLSNSAWSASSLEAQPDIVGNGSAFPEKDALGESTANALSGQSGIGGHPGLRQLADDPSPAYRHIARFLSSDGFSLLRGKNAKGNHGLLKIGKGHDLWLHAEDGPSAHVIIRRAHASEEIPEQTLREAAFLVGEKSWQRNDAKARVMVAHLRHVHPIRGAAPGTVRVDAVAQSIVVDLELQPSG